MTDTGPAEAVTSPARSLEGPEKVAALLLAMGKHVANRLLKHFDEKEIRIIARTAADLGRVPKASIESLVEEFAAIIASGGDLEGSAGEAEELLSGVMPADQVAEIMSAVKGHASQAVWPKLSQIPETAIAQFLLKEHPQVVAFVLSKASPACAAAVLGRLPAALRNEVMRRMLALKPVMEPPRRILEEALHNELLMKVGRNTGQDIRARIADILNRMERAQMDEIFQSLDLYRPKEAKVIKGLLFTFDDIAKLSPAARTKLFDEVPAERTILALRGADPQMTELILSSIGARARRIIEQELQSGAPVIQKEVLKARRAIADMALDMADRGLIAIHPEEEI